MKNSKKSIVVLIVIISTCILIALLIAAGVLIIHNRKQTNSDDTANQTLSQRDNDPKAIPSDIPLFKDAHVKYLVHHDNGFTAGIKMLGADKGKDVLNFYADELPKNGWVLEDDNMQNIYLSLTLKANKGSRHVEVVISFGNDEKDELIYTIEYRE